MLGFHPIAAAPIAATGDVGVTGTDQVIMVVNHLVNLIRRVTMQEY